MTRLRPCHRCGLRGGCERREAVLAAVAGSPVRLTLVNFACDLRLASLQPGAVAVAKLPALQADGYDPEMETEAWSVDRKGRLVEARVVVMEGAGGKRNGKLRVYSLDGQPGGDVGAMVEIFHVWPDQLKPTGEVVPLCGECARPLDTPVPSNYACVCSRIGRHLQAGEHACSDCGGNGLNLNAFFDDDRPCRGCDGAGFVGDGAAELFGDG